MRGMKRLVYLAQNMERDLDAQADAAADELVAGKEKIVGAIDQFKGLASNMHRTADDALAALGQISNEDLSKASGETGTKVAATETVQTNTADTLPEVKLGG